MVRANSEQFAGTERFLVQRRLGAGGMGIVYLALDRESGESVALKTLKQVDPTAIFRFKQEFRSLSELVHPHLIRMHELFCENNQWFFVMELIESAVDFHTYLLSSDAADAQGLSSTQASEPAAVTQSQFLDSSAELELEITTSNSDGGRVTKVAADQTKTDVATHATLQTVAPQMQSVGESSVKSPGSRTSAPVRNYVRLREAFSQLVSGVRGLHRAGMLHRDLKPANALVSKTGTVVLLDFGLIAELSVKRVEGVRTEIVGTVAYMSPEQAQGLPLTEATDWYSVGVMLFVALTGRLPFEGETLKVMQSKVHEDAPDPSLFADEIPADLHSLCVRLLKRIPEERPSGDEMAAFFGASEQEDEQSSLPSLLFVGRERHLADLADSFQQVRSGRTVVSLVHGRSGAGKSTLIQHFLDELAHRYQAIVLTGRCYEQESVPFKGVDSLIDALSQYLRANPKPLESLPSTHVAALARIFPILNLIPAIKSLGKRQIVTTDLQELRHQAFVALRKLLMNIGSDRPLVIYLDDLQWGDLDSAALLSHLLSGDQPPRMLLLLAYRSEYADSSPCLRELLAFDRQQKGQVHRAAKRSGVVSTGDEGISGAGSDLIQLGDLSSSSSAGESDLRALWKELRIDPLTSSETRVLARSLLRDDVPQVEQMADRIVTQSGGSAYFVMELARHVNSGQDLAAVEDGQLDDVLWRHITQLSDEAQQLMQVIAVSGQPIPLKNALEAARLPGLAPRVLAKLRTDRLVRSSGPGRQAEIEAYHDRIRESVVNHLDVPTRQAHHRQLAETLQRSGEANPETIAGHLEGSLQFEKAGRFYSAAAELALEKLAFDRAEEFAKHAVRLAVSDDDKVNAHERLVHYFTDMARFSEAYAQGRAGAKEFGVSLPARFVPPLFMLDFVKAKWGLRGKQTADLVHLPTMQDARLAKAVRIINACAKAAYQVRPELCVAASTKMVNLCLKFGNTPDCAIGWMVFGSIFQGGVLGNHPVGYDYGRLALSIVDKFQQEKQRPEVSFVVGYFGTSWMRPATEAEELWRTTYDSGQATGDLFHTGAVCAATIQSLFMRGVPLREIWSESDRFMAFLKPLNLQEPIGAIRSVRQAIRNLHRRTLSESTFSTRGFSEDEYVARLANYGSRHFAHFYYINKMLTQYLWKDYDSALATAQTSAKYLKDSPGMLHAAEHYFLSGLIQAAQAERSAGWKRSSCLRSLRSSAKRFAGWAKRCPHNFEHKSQLLTGELARLNGDAQAATVAFDAAIRTAGEFGYRHVQAMAHRLASRNFAQMGAEEQARYHRTLAEKSFVDWGAVATIAY